MKTTKRLLALVLCVVMVFGMIPVQAKAASDAVMVEHNGETTYYADLQKAFDGFAPSNNTYGGKYVVTLLADTTSVSKNLQYPTEVLDVTLDLNGHKLSTTLFNLTGTIVGCSNVDTVRAYMRCVCE